MCPVNSRKSSIARRSPGTLSKSTDAARSENNSSSFVYRSNMRGKSLLYFPMPDTPLPPLTVEWLRMDEKEPSLISGPETYLDLSLASLLTKASMYPASNAELTSPQLSQNQGICKELAAACVELILRIRRLSSILLAMRSDTDYPTAIKIGRLKEVKETAAQIHWCAYRLCVSAMLALPPTEPAPTLADSAAPSSPSTGARSSNSKANSRGSTKSARLKSPNRKKSTKKTGKSKRKPKAMRTS